MVISLTPLQELQTPPKFTLKTTISQRKNKSFSISTPLSTTDPFLNSLQVIKAASFPCKDSSFHSQQNVNLQHRKTIKIEIKFQHISASFFTLSFQAISKLMVKAVPQLPGQSENYTTTWTQFIIAYTKCKGRFMFSYT